MMLVLFTMVVMLVYKVNLSSACNMTALVGRSHSKIQPLLSAWLREGRWTWQPQKPRGAAAPAYKQATQPAVLTDEHQKAVEEWMDEKVADGQGVTRTWPLGWGPSC